MTTVMSRITNIVQNMPLPGLLGPSFLKHLLQITGVLTLLLLFKFFIRLYRIRTLLRTISKQNDIPLLPHSFLFGHLLAVGKHMAKCPPDAHGLYLSSILLNIFPDICGRGAVYIDIWPISPPMLVVFHPEIMNQFTVDYSLPKHDYLWKQFQPLTNCLDLLTLEGPLWKTWRQIFNPGFSAKNLIRFVPDMIEEVGVFRDWLKSATISGNVIKLAPAAERLTIDIAGRVVLGSRLHSQTQENALHTTLKDQISWLIVDNWPGNLIRTNWNPIRPFVIWMNNRIVRKCLMPHIQKALVNSRDQSNSPMTILDLAIRAYMKDKDEWSSHVTLDSKFIDILVEQLKLFMLTSHASTVTVLSYMFYILNTNPKILAAVRREHDKIFGLNPDTVTAKLATDPMLLNQLPYTSAVIKETLRLYPPVGTFRAGSANFHLVHPETRERYPTEGMMVYGCTQTAQRIEAFWPEPNRCIPERWLVPEDDLLHPPQNAFRPFELGSRNCIGQEIVLLELRLILAMTVREFDIISHYPTGGPHVLGDVAYMTKQPGQLSGYPKDGMPVRVRYRENDVNTLRVGYQKT